MQTHVSSVVLLLLAMLSPAGGASRAWAAPPPDWRADSILQRIQQARSSRGLAPLERRAELDAVARDRARRVARASHPRRLSVGGSLADSLARHGVRGYRDAWQHLDMLRGHRDPISAFVDRWKDRAPRWKRVSRPGDQAVGLATVKAKDGWTILVVVLLEDFELPEPAELERSVLEAVNRARAEHGLGALTAESGLAEVARGHSRDMARRGYFAHESPEGLDVGDRVERRGIRFYRLAENIHRSRNSDDPVSTAVRSWLDSPGHRRAMLDSRFTHTGVGVAFDDDAGVYFTQLFSLPLPSRTEAEPADP